MSEKVGYEDTRHGEKGAEKVPVGKTSEGVINLNGSYNYERGLLLWAHCGDEEEGVQVRNGLWGHNW